MTTFTGTAGDDALFGIVGDDTYQLGNGNDTITYNATVDGLGVLAWGYGADTIISADGGVTAPNYDRIVFGFSPDYLWGRKVGNNFEISIYAHAVTATIDPGSLDEVGKIIIVNAFSASIADRLSKIEAAGGFYYEAIAIPVADDYGHTAAYKSFEPGVGSVLHEEWFADINDKDTQHITQFTDGSAVVQYFDTGFTFPWFRTDLTYLNYGTPSQVLMRSEQYNDDGSVSVTVPGTSGNDVIVGNTGNDTLNGAAGDDNISGLAGNDTINGGAGNDTLLGGAGADTVIGGAGDDTMDGGLQTDALNFSDYNTLNYASTTSALTINTALGTASSSTDGNDTFVNFYRIRGGSGNDTIIGNSELHFEQFEGGAGDDSIDGGAITDTVNGVNTNRLTYQNAGAAVTVNLLNGTAAGGAGNDTIFNFNQVRGSNFNDTLQGSNTTVLTEQFEGGQGDDNIDGRGGFDIVRFNASTAGVTANLATGTATGTSIGTDTFVNVEGLFGSDFSDVLTGGLAANGVTVSDGLIEVFRGGAGSDTIDGGQGYDRVDYTTSTSGVSVTINAELNGSANDGLGGTDVLQNIEGVRGSDFNDSISGSTAANKLEGLNGNDQLRGGAGNDTLLGGEGSDYLTGGSGDDVLNGGNGIDTADYFFSDSSAAIVVNLVAGTATGGGGSDTLLGIENVNGSDFNDTITGDAANNFIDGRGGDDTLFGGAGADNLNGGAGNDVLDGGVILDKFFGSDWNFVGYNAATAGVNVNLSGITGDGSTGSGTATGDASVGVDTLKNINQVNGSNFNDIITGSTALIFEQFEGLAGDDTLDGGAITDTLNGEDENRVIYQNTTGAGVTVDFIAGTAVGKVGSNAGSDTLANFNQVRGSNFADTLLGSNRTDVGEVFEGRAGDDYIDGRGGFDIVRYSSATTQVVVNLVTGLATGAMGNDTLVGIEGARGGSGNDILTGGNAANGVVYNDGLSETFRGEGGNDIIDGGQGYDRADYNSSTSGVVVTLNDTLDGTASDGLGGTDILRNIEAVRGSMFADVLTGSNTAIFESFEGQKGNDTINGLGGIDRVDYRYSRAGVTVNLVSGTASDGEGGTDTLFNIENVRGSRDFDDTITGSAADNRLEGLGGDDTLNGGDGNDLLIGGLGNDILSGGTGIDTASYADATAAVTVTLGTGLAQTTVGAGIDTLASIENLTGSAYSDTLTGNTAANRLEGGAGDDILNGGAGIDSMVGGAGSDRYYVDNTGDLVTETASDALSGIDTVYASVSYSLTANVENLRINGSGALNATGNTLNNVLYAGSGDNILSGGTGLDTASYAYATAAVTLNLGTGLVQATGGSGMDTFASIENLTGSAYSDTLTGNAAANRLDGGAGVDTMSGGAGADEYVVDNAGDIVVEWGSDVASGIDTVLASVSYTLSSNVENLRINSAGAANATGNGLNNVLYAGAGDNVLSGGTGLDTASYADATGAVTVTLGTGLAQSTGGSGMDKLASIENLTGGAYDDRLTGNAAANTLEGGAGNDILTGSGGQDQLSGGTGADAFRFNSLLDSGITALTWDTITDFNGAAGDLIDLYSIDANTALAGNQGFSFIGSAAFSAAGQVRYDTAAGVLYGSVDADADAEFAVQLTGLPAVSLTDFVL